MIAHGAGRRGKIAMARGVKHAMRMRPVPAWRGPEGRLTCRDDADWLGKVGATKEPSEAPVPGRDQAIEKTTSEAVAGPALEVLASPDFTTWLAEQGVSVAFTTYKAGKLFLVGLSNDSSLSIFERTFAQCMGLCASGSSLFMGTRYQIWRFENAVVPGQSHDGFDAVFVPQVGYVTGNLDAHDMALDGEGRVIFVNTRFSCLATTSGRHSFVPLWRPPFITNLAAEDRCHLNGLAMEQGAPRFVTAVAATDEADGWRAHRARGGVVIDVPSGETVVAGLSMPHSPRLHDGRLWLHDSGAGYFGYADLDTGRFERVTFCPGYLRGLSFFGSFAVVGLSLPRDSDTFSGLALDDTLSQAGVGAVCAIQIIDLRSGEIVHWLQFKGVVDELYDVLVLAGLRRPMAIGLVTDDIERVISVGDEAPLGESPHPILVD